MPGFEGNVALLVICLLLKAYQDSFGLSALQAGILSEDRLVFTVPIPAPKKSLDCWGCRMQLLQTGGCCTQAASCLMTLTAQEIFLFQLL